MKKFLLILSVIFFATAATNAQQNEIEAALKTIVQTMNAECPVDMDDEMQLIGVADNGKFIVFNVQIDDDEFDEALTPEAEEYFKDEMEYTLEEMVEDEDFAALVSIIVYCDRGITFYLRSIHSAKVLNISFSPEELTEILD